MTVDSVYLESAVCARMLTMKHWFRVSFILCRYKARSVHFAYIVSSLGIFIFFFIFFSTYNSLTFAVVILAVALLHVSLFSIYIFFRFSGSTSHENRIEEQYSIQFEKHRPQWCRSSRWFWFCFSRISTTTFEQTVCVEIKVSRNFFPLIFFCCDRDQKQNWQNKKKEIIFDFCDFDENKFIIWKTFWNFSLFKIPFDFIYCYQKTWINRCFFIANLKCLLTKTEIWFLLWSFVAISNYFFFLLLLLNILVNI